MNELSQLARRRGFFFPSNEAYGGVSGFYTYGPQGSAMKQNIEDVWRDRFITKQNNMEIDAPTVFPEDVFDASSHLETFNDLLIECQHCQESHRADHLIEDNTDIDEAEHFSPEEISDIIAEHEISCPTCGEPLIDQPVNEFNLMFKTNIGPSSHNPGYLRPETAQGIFVEFPRLKEYARGQLPFGVGQIGRAYRNEISPRNALIRVREFTQAELEMFIDPNSDSPTIEQVEDVTLTLYSAFAQERNEGHVTKSVTEALDSDIINNEWIAYYLGLAKQWYQRIGVDMDRFRFRQHQSGELSHYAVDCWDAEAEVDGDWFELAGFAYRSDYDLQKHTEHSDEEFTIFKQYDEPKTVESVSVDPDMSYLGPQFGEKAAAIAEAIQSKAEREPTAFDHDEISVEVDDETYTIPRDKTGFERQQVTKSGHHITPHIIEPSFGVGRALYTVFCHAYETDEVNGETRNVLRLEPDIAPTFIGVFPLMAKDGLAEKAKDIATTLRSAGFSTTYDTSGAIGRRYRRQDEIGTPYCVTIDYETIEEGEYTDTVTLRDRDSATQIRVPIDKLVSELNALHTRSATFGDLIDKYGKYEN